MAKSVVVLLAVISEILFAPHFVFAQDNKVDGQVCDIFRTTFIPSEKETSLEYVLNLKIKNNKEYRIGENAKYFFEFNLLDRSSSKVLATVVADYKCYMGDYPRCNLQFSEGDDFDVLGIDVSFNPVFSYKKNAPYSIIIPRLGGVFRDSTRYKKIKFYSKNKTFPIIGFPVVWVNKSCE